MASTRMIATTLWTLPLAVVLVLFAWAFVDFLGTPTALLAQELLAVLLASLATTILGLRFGYAALRRLGLALLVLTYFAAHLTVLRLDATASLAFLTLALLTVELRILADRFVPLYTARLDGDDRARVASALQRSMVRIASVSGAAFLASVLAADLALAGTLPVTTIPTALGLSAALVGVILLMALWPQLERREA
ncbi:MAG TPA: hypothetical protein VEY12_05125 [Thermoplasmata archaeon]|nr:hypothetical protein [Thermoplasmata archaeon]